MEDLEKLDLEAVVAPGRELDQAGADPPPEEDVGHESAVAFSDSVGHEGLGAWDQATYPSDDDAAAARDGSYSMAGSSDLDRSGVGATSEV